jgi:hypothetical protein
MWTKCLSPDGNKVFYYNSAKNISAWTPPPDSIVHEAVNLHLSIVSDNNPPLSSSQNNDNDSTSISTQIQNDSIDQLSEPNRISVQRVLEDTL